MKVLHVSNGNLKHCGKRYYDQSRKITNGLIRNNHDVFFLSDRDTARASNPLGIRKLGIKSTNKYFIEICKNYAPDIIFLGHADIISLSSLNEAKIILPNVKIAQWNVDALFIPSNVQKIKSKIPAVDATFITTAGDILKQFHHTGKSTSFFPNIVDDSVEWPKSFNNDNQDNDVFWAVRLQKGSFPNDPKYNIPLFLEQNKNIKIDYHGMNGKPELFNNQYFERINNSKMGINISSHYLGNINNPATEEESYLYSSDRISHYMGSGLLTFTTNNNRLEDLFLKDKEIIIFNDKNDLLDKIIYFKKNDNERKEIAQNGWKKVHRDFNSKIVTQYMIETIMSSDNKNINYKTNYPWPTTKY